MAATEEMSLSFLLVGRGPKALWTGTVERALCGLGELELVREDEAVEAVVERDRDMVLVDAGAVQDASLLVSRLRARRSELCVIVFTSSPTWRRTRDVLRAGAMDYVPKSLNADELRTYIESKLGLPAPKL